MTARGIELTWPGKGEPLGLAASWTDLEHIERLAVDLESPDEPSPAAASTAVDGWRNMLIRGDNLLAAQALAERLSGQVDLVYIDPPFATGLNYYSHVASGPKGELVERRAYRDNPERGMAGYLDHSYARLELIHRLLAPQGKLFLHCDWRANSMLRLLLDELFGPECFRNEIIWRRAPNLGRQAASKQLGRVIDTILVYSKTPGAVFEGIAPKRSKEVALNRKGAPKNARWDEERQLYFTTAPRGDYTDASIEKLREQGRVYEPGTGKIYIKYYLQRDERGRWVKEQPVDTLWDDFAVRPLRHRPKSEDMGYDTQKPEGLLERIISWATKPGDLVADFYCGSGTSVAVAEALGRRWIGCDIGQVGIDVTRRRLLQREARCFDIYSILGAERRSWAQRVGTDAEVVLEAYGAKFHADREGKLDDRNVYVAEATAAPGEAEIEAWCQPAVRTGAQGLDVLAWRYSIQDAGSLRKRMREQHGLELSLRLIPQELLQGGPKRRRKLHFAELPDLQLELVVSDSPLRVHIRLLDLVVPSPPPRRGEQNQEPAAWHELIDSWMVDWSCQGAIFSPSWRARRDSNGETIALQTPQRDLAACGGKVLVKLVTVYGDEIVRSLRVQ